MKTALVSAALLLGLSTTAFAAGNATGRNYYPGEAAVPQTSHVTRAEVKADLAKAQAEGTLAADNRADYPAFTRPPQRAKPAPR
jgi:hypothetical protein